MLEALTDKEINVHTVMLDSGKLDMFIYNTLKKSTGGNKDTIIYVNKKSDIEEMSDLALVMPMQADQWLFIINYDKVKRHRRKIIELIKKKNISSKYLVSFSKYADFKKFNEDLGSIANSMYLKNLNLTDVRFLFRKYRFDKDLFQFIFYSYRSEVEKMMSLLSFLETGHLIKSRKDVTDLVGVSTGSVQHFIFQLLGKKPLSEKSQKTVLKNRVNTLTELSKVYGVRSLKGILTNSVKDILDIKSLYLNGVIYKTIDNIPEGYVATRLLKYKPFYAKILDISYMRILDLYLLLYNERSWNSEVEMYQFIYTYYRNLGIEED
jgi:hypothetical protein